MNRELVRWLEEDGWDILSVSGEDGLRARRQRGERVEILRVGQDDRLLLTLTRPLGDETFRRVGDRERRCRVVTRSYTQTTVTCEIAGRSIRSAVDAALRAATG